jgi:hypothetical protein
VKQQSDSDEYQVDGEQEHSEVFGDVHGFCLKQRPSLCTLKIGAEKSLRIPAYHFRSPLVNSDPGAHVLKLHCLLILFLETQCATDLYLGRVKKAHFGMGQESRHSFHAEISCPLEQWWPVRRVISRDRSPRNSTDKGVRDLSLSLTR